MSAIFGLIHLDDQPVVQSDLERTSAALAHHGADGGAWTRGPVGLGMRLRQCTPEDQFERQPLVRADGALILVSDARIDNRDELIPQLPVTNYPFPSQITDSELILCAYEKWGEACVNHLVGVFAFAIWEARSQRLFLARSPIEAPMLCYYAAPRVFAFASMPSGLFALPFVPRALDEERLADLLVQTGSEPRFTFYRDIFRLPIGHALTIGRDGMNLRRYWQPDLKREIRLPRDEDYLAAFDDLLERVVRDQLRSQTPVGVMMSGGLDSSTVAATAARLLAPRGERLAAFTEVPRSGFDGSLPAGRFSAISTVFSSTSNPRSVTPRTASGSKRFCRRRANVESGFCWTAGRAT
jgi:asparagine synthase (glutamine-hydrolysing)